MHCGKQLRFNRIGAFSILLLLFSLFSACQEDPVEVPKKDEFTKEKLETLGDRVLPGVLYNYDFIPDISPYDTSIYWYVRTIYNQATSVMKLDKQSPQDNRWDQSRSWDIFIINDDNLKHAFTLPGGHFFISTGMLRSFEREYELYYLMTFEASLMHEGHLLNLLIQEYNSLTLNNLIEGRSTASGITIEDIANNLPGMAYESDIVKDTDRNAVRSVCATSILEPTGITPSLFKPEFQDTEWLKTRPSYNNRPESIQGFAEDNITNCGGSLGTGNYDRYVLNVLN